MMEDLHELRDTEGVPSPRALLLERLIQLRHTSRQPAKRQSAKQRPDGPAWQRLGPTRCHICHNPITDAASRRVRIGGAECRPRIEQAEHRGPEMWETITPDELEVLWLRYNLYGVYLDGKAYPMRAVHTRYNTQQELLSVTLLSGTARVMLKRHGVVTFCSLDEARAVYRAWQ